LPNNLIIASVTRVMLMSYPNKVRSLTSSLARQGCSIAVALDVAIFFFFVCVCVV